jgi:hypothetical protein
LQRGEPNIGVAAIETDACGLLMTSAGAQMPLHKSIV